ncbi:superoxide dismutase, Ni [Candidatus Daviesbacteria bacterium]|nr:superoxide dismutase, Ni [Candidatus Daviesbacteria bacterium]
MKSLARLVSSLLPLQTVYAHCDIPCGIYDPHNLQMAAHTILRMTSMINDLKPSSEEPPFDERKRIISQLARLTKVKEDHAEIFKYELRILWGDYFKEEHLKNYPDLHDLVFKTMKLASKVRQEVNLEAARQLLKSAQEIAEIFYQTKGFDVVRIPSGYPTEGELISHK